jgi:hypothetical protein
VSLPLAQVIDLFSFTDAFAAVNIRSTSAFAKAANLSVVTFLLPYTGSEFSNHEWLSYQIK